MYVVRSFWCSDGSEKTVSGILHFHVAAVVSRDKSFLRRKDSRVMLSIFFLYLLATTIIHTKTSLVSTAPPCLFLTTTLVNNYWIL